MAIHVMGRRYKNYIWIVSREAVGICFLGVSVTPLQPLLNSNVLRLVGTAVFCSICKEFINIMLDILDFPYMYTNHIGCVTFSSIEILRILPLLPSLDPTPFSDSRACLELALWAFPKATAPNASGGLCPCHWRSKFSGKKAGEGCCCCCY